MTRGEFAVVGKLVAADIRRRPGRLLLTVLSTIAAACVVVWVVSGYDSLVQSFRELTEKYLGRYELVVLPVGAEDSPLPPLSREVVDALRQDPAVAAVDPVFQSRVRIKAAKKTAGSDESENTPAPRTGKRAAPHAGERVPPDDAASGRNADPGRHQRGRAALSAGARQVDRRRAPATPRRGHRQGFGAAVGRQARRRRDRLRQPGRRRVHAEDRRNRRAAKERSQGELHDRSAALARPAPDPRTGRRRSVCALDAGRNAGGNPGEDRLCGCRPGQRHQDRRVSGPLGRPACPCKSAGADPSPGRRRSRTPAEFGFGERPWAGLVGYRHFALGGAVHHFHHAQYGRGRADPAVRHAARGFAHESASRRHDRHGKPLPGADRLGRRSAGRLGICWKS